MTDIAKLCERLRTSATAFREHTVYDSEGDPLRLIVQADELDEAADLIERLAAMLAASPQGEGSSAAPIPTEQLEGAVVGADEPIGNDGKFAYRTTLMGERHIVHVATGFVWFKLPYDYRYTDNASQRRNAETMLAALLGRPAHPAPITPSADTGELRERVAATCHKLLCDELGLHPDEAADLSAGVFADTILDLIQSERGK